MGDALRSGDLVVIAALSWPLPEVYEIVLDAQRRTLSLLEPALRR